ncbi:DUF1054 family protein [Lacticaseibacillus absianus]|uniref:DUF1054 family protein n=1 Tax=Lacticaseibacillus absianus TaxID=2729623 RepID=UPI0015CE9E1A
MFEREDFAVFEAPTLPGRLALIRRDLDPKFEQAGQQLVAQLAAAGVPDQTVHIAKHLRRYKFPPPDTWLALSASHRGYKMVPHLELGLWDDRLFLWLALLGESKAHAWSLAPLRTPTLSLPAGFELSGDHTNKVAHPLTARAFDAQVHRFETVKRAEFLIGRTYLADSSWFDHPTQLWADVQARVQALAPLYQQLLCQ